MFWKARFCKSIIKTDCFETIRAACDHILALLKSNMRSAVVLTILCKTSLAFPVPLSRVLPPIVAPSFGLLSPSLTPNSSLRYRLGFGPVIVDARDARNKGARVGRSLRSTILDSPSGGSTEDDVSLGIDLLVHSSSTAEEMINNASCPTSS